MKTMRTILQSWRPGIVLAAVTVAAVATLAYTQPAAPRLVSDKSPPDVTVDERPLPRDLRLTASFAPVVKKVSPSVVKVYTTAKAERMTLPGSRGFNPGWPPWLFGEPFEGPRGRREVPMPRQQGVGSGVIVTKDGYILTNHHVVDGAEEVRVTLMDGREFTAKVVGKDAKTDIAVLKVDGKDLPHLPMADSDQIEVGDVVLAVGNPFNVGQTVTLGMVSAKGRGGVGLDYEDFIQTDAAINPGNSGGALVDVEGRLVGLNTAILSRSGGNQGIGFAIPSNLARDVMDSLIEHGSVTRGYLGISIQDLTPSLAKEFKMDKPAGALVGEVVPDSPAAKAGLKSGDVVVQYDGRKVTDSRHLKLQVARTKPGTAVPVQVLRDGAEKTIRATVKELPAPERMAQAGSDQGTDRDALHGVAVADLDGQARRQFDVPSKISGAVITDLEPSSAAAEAGLKPGDVILEINRQPVKTAEDAVRLTEHPKDRTTLLKVWSNGGTRFVVVNEGRDTNTDKAG